LTEGGGMAIDREVTGVVARRSGGTWDVPLAAPVVLGTRYSTCNGPTTDAAKDPCCATCKTSVNLGSVNLSLLRYGDALVPALCNVGETPSQSTVTAQGASHPDWAYSAVVRTCLHSTTAPALNQAVAWTDTTMLPSNSKEKWDEGTEFICTAYSGTTMLVGLRGAPLMGGWTLADSSLTSALRDRWTSGSAAPIVVTRLTKPSGITAIEVLFFVAAEPKPMNVPAVYLTYDPATFMNAGGL